MAIKKAYVDLVELLQANKNKKVETLLPQILELATAKQAAKNFLTNDKGETTHIYCYYHKKWEEVKHYGKKKHSASGYNSMCKIGVNQWTKQQRLYKVGMESLVDEIADGTLSADMVQEEKEKLHEERSKIVPREDEHGFDNLDDIK